MEHLISSITMHNVGTGFDTDVQGQDLLEGAKIPALE